MSPPLFVWHYTEGHRAAGIIASGYIRTARALVKSSERRAAWFTTRETYEPTASKMLGDPATGEILHLDVAGMLEMGLELWRFGVSTADVSMVTWEDHKRRGGIPARDALFLESSAIDSGSDPASWWLSYQMVPMDRVVHVDVWDGARWRNAHPAAVALAQRGAA